MTTKTVNLICTFVPVNDHMLVLGKVYSYHGETPDRYWINVFDGEDSCAPMMGLYNKNNFLAIDVEQN